MTMLRSDNNAGLCPEAARAILDADDGHTPAYGDDPWTKRAVDAIRAVFGESTAVFFVATGTAANTLAIASLTRPWQQVLCHRHSHYNDDESTAPERITGCRTQPIDTPHAKLTADDLQPFLQGGRGDVHQPAPGVVTLTNPTEFGTVYTPDELAAICGLAHENGYRVHVDGARFANAVASLDCDPKDLTARAGVDAMSLGGTKNGLAAGEAVLFFPQGDGSAFEQAQHDFPFHRKSTGHLLSKHRFMAAPFAATLRDDIWLRHAGHANEMARRLDAGLADLGIERRFPVEANGVFAVFQDALHKHLQQAGHGYYPFGDASWQVYRLMCSFDTTAETIDQLLADAEAALH